MEVYIFLGVIIMFLIAFIVFKEITYLKTIDKLTSKILAKDFREYSFSELEQQREITKRKKQPDEKKVQGLRI